MFENRRGFMKALFGTSAAIGIGSIPEVKALDAKENNIIVLKYKRPIGKERREYVKHDMQSKFPDKKFLIVDETVVDVVVV